MDSDQGLRSDIYDTIYFFVTVIITKTGLIGYKKGIDEIKKPIKQR